MPTTDWIHAVHVICDAASIASAIAALDIAFPCDDGAPRNPTTPENYGCQLSANGELPATHYGSSFVVTESIRQHLESLGLAQTPGVTYWRCVNPGGELVVTNHVSGGPIGNEFGFDDAVKALGLFRVVIPIEGV